ncbi:ceramidase domain-containing protein [Bosea sp. NPDC055594]
MGSYGYCERTDPSFWAEPLNAWSNGAFLLAALAGLILLWRVRRADWPVAILITLVFAIAIGSFLFHTMPRRWTLLADMVPIQLFAFFYFGLALRRFFGLAPAAAFLGTLAFLAASSALAAVLALWLPPVLRGSAGYAGFVLALFGVAAALAVRGQAGATARQIGLAGLVFGLSLTFRSLDGLACQHVPFGLHWAWHLLNATVLYLLLRAALTHRSASTRI